MDAASQSPKSESQIIPKWLIILLLIFFPPAAWYFMWKQKKYHGWFPNLLILNGVLMFLLSFTELFVVIPEMMYLYEQFNAKTNISNMYNLVYYLLTFCSIQILSGIFIRRKIISSERSVTYLLVISLVLLIVDFVLLGYGTRILTASLVYPVYNLTNSL